MKKLSTLLLIASILFISSCNNDTVKAEKTDTITEEIKVDINKIADGEYLINNKLSKVNWSAQGVAHGHNGTVNIVAGKFIIEGGLLKVGKAKIDMNSIICLDIEKADENKDLVDHLLNEDFFDVTNFPSALINIINVEGNTALAKMTIKDVSQDIKIPISVSTEDGKIIIKSSFKIDRTKFGVKYNSKNFFKNLGDYMIEDEIQFDVTIVSK